MDGRWEFNSEALAATAIDVDGLQLATLDTLHYRLARDAKGLGRVLHWEPTWRCLFNELGAELIGETDLPGRAGSELLAADEAVEELVETATAAVEAFPE